MLRDGIMAPGIHSRLPEQRLTFMPVQASATIAHGPAWTSSRNSLRATMQAD